MPFVTSSDVDSLQVAVRGQWDALNAAVQDGADKLKGNRSVNAQLTALQRRVEAFLGKSSSVFDAAAQMDEGQAIQRDIATMTDTLSRLGVSNLPPKPAAASSPTLATMFGGLVDALPILLVLLIVHEFRGGSR